jgi:hypothetical protein|tara:strand:+ start:355 stop:462 length:108 start_codon:yes stop_codon:yes gene_type:complete
MDYLEELTNEYDNIEDVAREQGVDMGRQNKENEDD